MSSTSDRIARLSPEKLAFLKRAIEGAPNVPEPIAVVGMGCRFPACRGIDDYWRVIRDAVDVTGEIPESRWDIDDFYDASGGLGKMTTRSGGFLEDVDRFDAMFFGISPREAERMDPQQRLMLEVVWEALEYGAIAPSQLCGTSTGVFVGVGGTDYSRVPCRLENYFEQITAHSGTGNALSIVANRVSYILDLRGPSVSIDTACSSSLVATHLAMQSLRSGECDIAIAGGVNLILTPETTLAFSQTHMLSPEGKCRPFDSRANGYVRGEGCGAVILKRLSDAVDSGDILLATIRGSAVNQDGRTSGIAAPRGPAQVSVIRRALADAGIGPEDISYIETHGTGTPLGDPIEIHALGEVFRNNSSETPQACYFGSVKANVGHTETCAGMASLIKTILMLRERCIPEQKHFEGLNPNINLQDTRLRIARDLIPWQASSERRLAGISSFGFGGTNAHIVVEEAAQPQAKKTVGERPKHLLVLSAKSPESLRGVASRYAESLDQGDPQQLADVCFTAGVGRTHLEHRLAIPTADSAALQQTLRAVAEGKSPREAKQNSKRAGARLKVAFLFAGQGSQYQGMGQQLYDSHPVFREAIEECDEILQDHLPQRLLTALFDDPSDEPLLHQTQYTQPALFALEYALSKLWRSIGVEPAVMIGHSVGEYVASCEAGVFSLEDGLRLLAHRARLMQSLPRDGMMAVIFAQFERVAEAIAPYTDDVAIAAHNGPQNVVISGNTFAIRELLDRFESDGVRTQTLNVSHAFHSPLMDPILDEFERLAGDVTYSAARIPLVSNRTGRLIGDEVQSASYWRNHLRNTVRFSAGVAAIEEIGIDVALEIGPDATLLGMARRAWMADDIAWLPSLRAGQNDWDVLLDSVADLYTRGGEVQWREFDRPWQRKRLILPTYPFQGQSFWYDMSQRINPRTHHARIAGPSHPLLGHRLEMAGEKAVFEASIQQDQPAYLVDHCVDQSPVVPAAAFIVQALAAAKQIFGSDACSVSALSIENALVLADNRRRTVQLLAGPDSKAECPFEIYSQLSGGKTSDDEAWVRHVSGTLRAAGEVTRTTESIDCDEVLRRMSNQTGGGDFYEQMADCGLRYGPSFQVVEEIATAPGEALARLRVPSSVRDQSDQYQLHPAILDGCWQVVAGVVPDSDDGSRDLFLPTSVGRVLVHDAPDSDHAWVHVRRKSSDAVQDSVEADILLLSENGTVIAELIGARAERVVSSRRSRASESSNWLYEIRWQPDPLRDAPTTVSAQQATQWIVFADQRGLADDLTQQLRALGHEVWTVARGDEFRVIEDAASGQSSLELNPLEAAGYQRLLGYFDSDTHSPPLQVVDLWGADTLPLSEESDSAGQSAQEICGHALYLLKELAKSSHWSSISVNMVTRGAQSLNREDPVSAAQSTLWGLGRTALVEMPHLSCRLIDLDPNLPLSGSASDLLEELVGRSTEDHVAYRGRQRYLARLQPAAESLEQVDESGPTIPASKRYSLRLTTPGSLDAMRYAPVTRRPIQPGEVELSVGSAGLNFSDVLKALGLYPGIKDEIVPLGIEFAGVVTALGQGAERFEVGQRVMGVAPYSFGSHVVTPEYALVATPDGLMDDEAATIPIAFLTAYQALCRLARLRSGERVLIHAGAGGVGLAAIQIAQTVGAEIFATAGSDKKREFLQSLGVSHVMNSRTLEFADQILEITSGQGVDVVLNSLPGEAITKSLSILSAYGRFLEIGKTDIYQNRLIGLRPFQDNLSYFAIDLDRMLRQRPDDIREMYQEVMPYFQRGQFKPLPLAAFPAEQVVDAFRYMAQRKNIGKVVVSFGSERSSSPQANSDPGVHVRDDATYLVTGGLGALGLKLAPWLGSQGARHLVLMSRGEPDEHAAGVIEELSSSGVAVAVIRGDVSDHRSLEHALGEIPEEFPPLRGVIHAAGVLDDGIMMDMDLQRLDRAMSPKVQGAWNLHRTIHSPLDFFVLFSSVAAAMGSPGQANYAAGNAFLDGLAAYRSSRGLPATSIAWGPWDDAGMAADDEVRRQLKSRGMQPLSTEAALEILGQAIRNQPTHLVVVDARWDAVLAKLPSPATTLLDELDQQVDASAASRRDAQVDEALCQRIHSASAQQRIGILTEFIRAEVGRVMGGDVAGLDLDQPLASLGLDSLMGMELKSNIESKLGIAVPAASLLDGPSVTSLAEVVSGLLKPTALDTSAEAQPADGRDAADPPNALGNGRVSADRGDRPESFIVAFGGARKSQRIPLFCLHPVGGDLRCYQRLARHLPDHQLYGLRASGLNSTSTAHASLDDMMSDYISAIRATQEEGPYSLMGWSTGGIFAYEIARRLELDDVPVGSLVMLDSPQPTVFQDVDLSDNARFLTDMVNFANYFSGSSMVVDYATLREKSEEDALNAILRLSQQERVLPAETTVDHLRRLVTVCKQHVRLFQAYHPQPCDLSAHLIRPQDTSMLTEATGQDHDEDFGWGSLVDLHTHQVPGHHFTMLTGDNAKTLANTLGDLLSNHEFTHAYPDERTVS